MNKVLMIAFDFPPCKSAGVQRTLKFCEQLPQFGWLPAVLTARSYIYNAVDHSYILPEPLKKRVFRAYGFNAFKHFSINGKYLEVTALPDPYSTWFYHAAYLGKKICINYKPDVIWSTSPYITTHRIAAYLKRQFKIPWIADYRDPFRGHDKKGNSIDSEVIHNADLIVFTTLKMSELYKNRYPDVPHNKFIVIENGFNEEAFNKITNCPVPKKQQLNSEFVFLHSGELYENGRSPEALLKAISLYKKSDAGGANINIRFRGTKPTSNYKDLILKLNIEDNIDFAPSISYESSIKEMMNSDALIVIQGTIFNAQIPGKVYEYLRSKKPILAIVDLEGATANLLNNVQHAVVVDINDSNAISRAFIDIQNVNISGNYDYSIYDRVNRSKELASYLNRLVNI